MNRYRPAARADYSKLAEAVRKQRMDRAAARADKTSHITLSDKAQQIETGQTVDTEPETSGFSPATTTTTGP